LTENKPKFQMNSTAKILALVLIALVVGAAVGFVTGRQFPVTQSNSPTKPDYVFVSGTAYAGINTYGTLSIGFGTSCSPNPPAGFSFGCSWAVFPVGFCPLYGSCTPTNGPYIAKLKNAQAYRMALSFWGNSNQTQRLACEAGNLNLNSTSEELTQQNFQCTSGPESIYGFS
jgi:hypothetical protein